MKNDLQGREWFELNFKIVQSNCRYVLVSTMKFFRSDKNSFDLPRGALTLCSMQLWQLSQDLQALVDDGAPKSSLVL